MLAALPAYLRVLESDLIESLGELGVEIEILWIERGTSLSTLDCHFTLSTWIADYPDPDGFFRGLLGERHERVLGDDELSRSGGRGASQPRPGRPAGALLGGRPAAGRAGAAGAGGLLAGGAAAASVGEGRVGEPADADPLRPGHGRPLSDRPPVLALGGSRAGSLQRLDGATVDVLVIGAGIIGASAAWAAAQAGARVAVVDRGDLAGATSSASSKLLHGGLRYLAMGDLRLVREAHGERRLNAQVLAPHLVRPLDFVVPVARDAPVPLWKVRAGVWLYGSLARFGDGRSGRIADLRGGGAGAGAAAPTARGRGALPRPSDPRWPADTGGVAGGGGAGGGGGALRGGGASFASNADAWPAPSWSTAAAGAPLSVTAGAVINAAGPWVDAVRRLEAPAAGTSVLLSKGAHLLLDGGRRLAGGPDHAAAAGAASRSRCRGRGCCCWAPPTSPTSGDPAAVAATDADQRQILDEARARSSRRCSTRRACGRGFAGLRVLPAGAGATARVRRETVIGRGPAGMVSVAGGKLTTWRVIGRRAAAMALAGSAAPAGAGRRATAAARRGGPADHRVGDLPAAWPRLGD